MDNKIELEYVDGATGELRKVECDLELLCNSATVYHGEMSAADTPLDRSVKIVTTTDFQLRDIEQVMRTKMNWPKAADIQKIWSTTPAKPMKPTQKNAKEKWDGTILQNFYSIEWAAGKNQELKEKYNEFISNDGEKLRTNNALKYLKGYCVGNSKDALLALGKNHTLAKTKDMQDFHRDYQFQFITVGQGYAALIKQLKRGSDEFYAISGPCSLYAAIGRYEKSNNNLKIESVLLYLRDTFDFNAGSGKDEDQYLGHWSKKGLKVHPGFAMNTSMAISVEQGFIDKLLSGQYPLVESSDDVYYCVRNSTYANWRKKHNKGGDILVFSKVSELTLKNPIVITK